MKCFCLVIRAQRMTVIEKENINKLGNNIF